MNLEDVLSAGGLQQDEWSLTEPKFGEESQLQVVGWSGKCGANKLYILKCGKCVEDVELFGEGYFKILKGALLKGVVPCGCSIAPQWSKEQYAIRCSRKARELGYTFLGFEGKWESNTTKVKMLCEKHGEWKTGSIVSLVSNGFGCPRCGRDSTLEAARQVNIKSVTSFIDSFFASGAFHPETKFWRSERKTKSGFRGYWFVFCPECGETNESLGGNLRAGQRPCGCNIHQQRECYVNWLIDNNNMAVAIKFGIARDSKQRVKRQNSKTTYNVLNFCIYSFPTVQQCKQAERECLQELECGVVSKCDMKDGYTETTHIENLFKIIEIYERNGGVKK